MEGHAFVYLGFDVDFAPVFFDDVIGDGKAQSDTDADTFCGKPRIEDFLQIFARYPDAGIRECHPHPISLSLGFYGDYTGSIYRLAGVYQHAHERLIDLVGPAPHQRNLPEFFDHVDPVGGQVRRFVRPF